MNNHYETNLNIIERNQNQLYNSNKKRQTFKGKGIRSPFRSGSISPSVTYGHNNKDDDYNKPTGFISL